MLISKKPGVATDSEPTDDDVIVRYEEEEVIGFTVLHDSKRAEDSAKPKAKANEIS